MYPARIITVNLSVHLHPYFEYASSDDSGGYVHLHRVACALVVRLWDKH